MQYKFDEPIISVERRDDLCYDGLDPPYDPSGPYPEYQGNVVVARPNVVFEAVREGFRNLGYDSDRYGTSQWSPLSFLVPPDAHVLVKPAMTTDVNPTGHTIFAIIPHGSVIRAVVEYIALARPKSITIADGPIPNSNFDDVANLMGLPQIAESINSRYGQRLVTLVDLRDEYSPKDSRGFIIDNIPLAGDPLGYTNVDIGSDSELAPLDGDWTSYRSVSSHSHERYAPPIYHNKRQHIYSIPNTVLRAHVVVNISKLKTHRKVGITCTLKNVVGITNKKYWLPHFRAGIDSSYLDPLPRLSRSMGRVRDRLKKTVYKLVGRGERAMEYPCCDGNWPGEDTTWRMVRDLYRIMLYADSAGKLSDTLQRRHFSVIDGIIGGMGFGPLAPRSKRSQTLILGINPRSTDAVAAHLIGYDPAKIPLLAAEATQRYPLLGCCSLNALKIVGSGRDVRPLYFDRPAAWRGVAPAS